MSNPNNNFSLRSVLEKDKLNGIIFLDWHKNLRIVLKKEDKLYVLDAPMSAKPPVAAPRAERDAYRKHHDDALDMSCFMLATMKSELQKQHEDMDAYEMIAHLKNLFVGHAREER